MSERRPAPRRAVRAVTALVLPAALAAGALAVAAEPTAPSFSLAVSRTEVRTPGATALDYRLRMRSGSQAERFVIEVRAPLFVTRSGSSTFRRREGTTIVAAGPARLEGPGRLSPYAVGFGLLGCGSLTRVHGYEPATPSYVVELPARSAAVVVLPYRTGDFPLWADTDLRLAVDVRRDVGPRGAPTLAVVRSPAVRVTGRVATRLELWTDPPSSPAPLTDLRRIRAGSRIEVVSRATPARAGRRITVLLRTGREQRVVGRGRTGRDGRARIGIRAPRQVGRYELYARTADDAGTGDAVNCPVGFRVPARR